MALGFLGYAITLFAPKNSQDANSALEARIELLAITTAETNEKLDQFIESGNESPSDTLVETNLELRRQLEAVREAIAVLQHQSRAERTSERVSHAIAGITVPAIISSRLLSATVGSQVSRLLDGREMYDADVASWF